MSRFSEMLREDRIVITGMGCVSPSGNNVPEATDAIFAGRDGIGLMPAHITDNYPHLGISVAASVEGLDKMRDELVPRHILATAHTSAKYALYAAAEALRQANVADKASPLGQSPILFHGTVDPDRIGMSIGTGFGGGDLVLEAHNKLLNRDREVTRSVGRTVLRVLPERIVTLPSMTFGVTGPIGGVTAACATGTANVIDGARKILMGEVDVAVVGGADAQVNPTGIALFAGISALDKTVDPRFASRPFNATQNGFVMGEGAGILVLERESHARKRGAAILAYLVGCAETADAFNATSPSGIGAARAIRQALDGVAIGPGGVYINAHGTGTTGDEKELRAIADSVDNIAAISSTKGATGHMMGAAGAMETIITIEALRRKQAPPTLKLDDPIDIARELPTTPLHAVDIDADTGLNESFGFGGLNSAVVVQL